MAVGDDPCRPHRSPAAADGVQQVISPPDIQVGIIEAGEGGALQVLGGSRGTDGHVERVAELGVGPDDSLGYVFGEAAGDDCLPDAGGFRFQLVQVGVVYPAEDLLYLRREAVGTNKLRVSLRRHDKSGGDGKTGLDQFPQAGSLAAHDGRLDRSVLAEGDEKATLFTFRHADLPVLCCSHKEFEAIGTSDRSTCP